MKLKEEYEKTVATQDESGIIERVPKRLTGDRVFYIPHKPVIREDAATRKVRMVTRCKRETSLPGEQY